MGAPIGNRNAAGSRGGAKRKMSASLSKGRRNVTMSRLTGKKTTKRPSGGAILNAGGSNDGRNVWRPKSVRAK